MALMGLRDHSCGPVPEMDGYGSITALPSLDQLFTSNVRFLCIPEGVVIQRPCSSAGMPATCVLTPVEQAVAPPLHLAPSTPVSVRDTAPLRQCPCRHASLSCTWKTRSRGGSGRACRGIDIGVVSHTTPPLDLDVRGSGVAQGFFR